MGDLTGGTTGDMVRVLAVEDDVDHRFLLVRGLQGLENFNFQVDAAGTVKEAIERIDEEPPSCILLDLSLPDAEGLEALQRLRARTDIPIVCLTGRADLGVQALKHGAQGYLSKRDADPGVIASAVELGVGEQRARRERDLYSQIVDSSPDAIISTDAEGTITSWNGAAERLYGYSASEAIGQPLSFLAPADRMMEARQIRERVISLGSVTLETIRVRKDGRALDVSVSVGPIRGSDGTTIGFAAVHHDLTERKEAERQLAHREAQLNEAQRIAGVGSFEWIPETDELQWSLEMFNIFGRDPEAGEPTFEEMLRLVDPEDQARVAHAVELLQPDDVVELEVRLLRPDSTWVTVSVIARAVPNEDGSMRVVGTIQDVSERRRLEEELLQSQKMDALGGLAGGIAHDFNNLLGVIMNYGRFVLEDLPEDTQQAADIREMVEAADKGARLVKQLLAFSRKEVIRPEVVDLSFLVEQMQPMLSRLVQESMRIETNLSSDLCETEADRGQIEQVLLNLIVNARDAMPEGGVISIGTRIVDVDETYGAGIPDFKTGRYACLTVSDSGSGMSRETQARIFEPFYTTKPRGSGTGLGLSTVYGIVKRTGGFITVYSEEGLGTTFKVYLPTTDKTARSKPAAAPTLITGQGERILVVEDEGAVLDVITRILSTANYDVVAVTSTQEALALLEAEHHRIRLLLTDVIMPSMSGRTLSEITGLPTIFMSGYTDSIIEEQGILAEGVRFLPKPFNAQQLLATVRDALDDEIQAELGMRALDAVAGRKTAS